MVVAPIRAGQAATLRAVLAGMTSKPGMADPNNALIPFGQFPTLHFARLLVLEDMTLADRASVGAPELNAAPALAFLGECDGGADAQLAAFAREAAPGLRTIFAHCEGFETNTETLAWMRARSVAPATFYVNWVGRTVRQIREDAALHAALRALHAGHTDKAPLALHTFLRDAVARDGPKLSRPDPTPVGWLIANWLHAIAVPLLLLALLPLFLLGAPPFLIVLRRRERSDPEYWPRPTPEHAAALAAIEDHDVTNQFSALGSLKPGKFRLYLVRFLLFVLQYSTRHIYVRGRLARVGSIHFARWVLLNDNQRVLFASNYDGSLDSYMDDFINKVAWGLNLVFSNGIFYPRSDFLVLNGAKNEQAFKNYLRRHQLPTEVWYKAYPGLTALDLARNSRIRDGLTRTLNDAEARRWLALL